MKNLAIFSPNLGAISESFIKRHMQELLPGRSVIVAGSDKPPYCGHWDVDAPKFMLPELDGQLNLDRKKKLYKVALGMVGIKQRSNFLYNSALQGFLKDHNVSVLLGEYLDVSTTIIDLASKLNIKLFAHAHGYDISVKLREKFWRREYQNFNRTAGVITMSQYSKQLLIDLGIKEHLIHIIPYGVYLPEAIKARQENATVKCLAVGRMVPKKAPVLLLEAFAKAAKENPKLTLDYVGSGELFQSAVDYIKEHQLEDKVSLHKSLPNEEVHKRMLEADIFIQHSITCPLTGDQEGLPVAILEAMAHGLPVVSTRHAGIPESVSDTVSGFIVNEKDTSSMGQKILELSKDKSLRETMGKEGRKIVEAKFTWEIEKKSLLKLIEANL
ncbi:glycosyltransferase family 4 protein [Hymenobacter terrenus]|uniref:glycosyltransferase family 4 protein n=1 Tax=Hymenobacter terrenus TaxID=1629124 RepID=UPI00061947C7|nr:glycosyltransferase family 4 protein [Hymenobacter terrenus]